MRRSFIGWLVAAATVMVPLWAMGGNQEVAEQIAARLRDSGQLRGYRIGVKFQDGTAWLRGQVTSQEQADTAVAIVSQTPGVTRVENDLAIPGQEKAQVARSESAASNPVATPAGQPLQQVAGALAPDQFRMGVAPSLRTASVNPMRGEAPMGGEAGRGAEGHLAQRMAPLAQHASAQRPGQADPVPTSFTAGPAQPAAASALQQPSPTPAAPAAPVPTAVLPAHPAMPVAFAPAGAQPLPMGAGAGVPGGPLPIAQAGPVHSQFVAPVGAGMPPAQYDQPALPAYAWPAYAAYPNYAAVTYPRQYSPTAWPYIGPFYPYPQVPLGWRKVSLEWHDGWWHLDFDDGARTGPFSGIFRPWRSGGKSR
jgi:hypothetical protein